MIQIWVILELPLWRAVRRQWGREASEEVSISDKGWLEGALEESELKFVLLLACHPSAFSGKAACLYLRHGSWQWTLLTCSIFWVTTPWVMSSF